MCRKLCHFIWGIWCFHRSKDFEVMKAGKLAIQPKLSCQYSENTLMDLPSSVTMDIVLGVLSFLKNSVRARASSSITLKPKSPMLNGTKIGHTLIANAPFVNSRNSWLTRKRVQGSRKCFKSTALFWWNATWLWFDSFFWSYTSVSGCLQYL